MNEIEKKLFSNNDPKTLKVNDEWCTVRFAGRELSWVLLENFKFEVGSAFENFQPKNFQLNFSIPSQSGLTLQSTQCILYQISYTPNQFHITINNPRIIS